VGGTQPEVVTFGESMLLLVAEPGVPFAAAPTFRRSVAGAETNVAIGLARLGHRTRWLGRVGADPAGEAVLRQVRADGVDCRYVSVDPERPTGLLLRDSFPARAIDVQYARAGSAASHLPDGDPPPDALAGARLLHLTGITPMLSANAARATARLIDAARSAGLVVSFDPNVRHKLGSVDTWRATVGPLLRRADLVFAGEDELELLTERTAAEAVQALRAAGVRTVVTKAADKSASATTPDGRWRQPAFAVSVVDPVGAGDAFAAGYLSGWLRGLAPQRCLAEAAVVAALVVQTASDIDGLPTAAQRDRALVGFTDGGADVFR